MLSLFKLFGICFGGLLTNLYFCKQNSEGLTPR